MAAGSIFAAFLAGVGLGVAGMVLVVAGRLIVTERHAAGLALTVTLGLLGAFLGGFLAEGLGLQAWWQTLVVQALAAAILVFVVAGLVRSRSAGGAG